MTPQDIINIVLGNEPRIVDAISAGAGWEVWLQVEFVIECRARNWQVARELSYPGPSNYILDFLVAEPGGARFPIELKVESATNAGAAVITGFQNDVQKLLTYPSDPQTATGYALGVAYSGAAKNAMQNYVGQAPNRLYAAGPIAIGVLIETITLQ